MIEVTVVINSDGSISYFEQDIPELSTLEETTVEFHTCECRNICDEQEMVYWRKQLEQGVFDTKINSLKKS